MSRKARKDGSLNIVSIAVALIAVILIVVACMMPFWTVFTPDTYSSWPKRQWGLLKLSGKYTNVFVSPADIAWLELRDTTCQAASVWTGTGGAGGATLSTNGLAMVSAIGNAAQGVKCTPLCKLHASTRCAKYYTAVTINFATFGLLVSGALVGLIGAGMPLIGKERKKDRTTWLLVDLVGFLLAGSGCAAYYFFTKGMLNTFRETSWYPMESLGWCFFLAAAGAVLLVVPAIMQLIKILTAGDKKAAADSAQLLTAGASPDFLMPTAI